MPLVIPNLESSPSFDAQSIPDSTDWQADLLTSQATGVVSGCLVSPHTGSDLNVSVASGSVQVLGTQTAVTSTVASVSPAAATDRRDLIIYTPGIGVESSGSNTTNSAAVTGTPCGTSGWNRSSVGFPPVKPAIPSGSVILAEVYVAAATSGIAIGNLIDKTALVATNAPLPGGSPSVGAAVTVASVSPLAFAYTPLSLYALLAGPTFTGVASASTAAFSTNTTQLANCAFVQTAVSTIRINNVTFTSNNYTLALTDAGASLQASNGATAANITVPTNASVAFPTGTVISMTQTGSGAINLAAAGGVTITSSISGGFVSGSTGCRVEYSTIAILKTATNTWILSGDAG